MLGSGIVLLMTPKSNLSRHRCKCAGPVGMHQSAEPIKDFFHWSSTPLLTLCSAVRAGRSIVCQLLTRWLNWVTLSGLLDYRHPWKWHHECERRFKGTLVACKTDEQKELVNIRVWTVSLHFLLNNSYELWGTKAVFIQISFKPQCTIEIW